MHGLCTLIFLIIRILLLFSSSEIHDLCLSHLSRLRIIAFGWVGTNNHNLSKMYTDWYQACMRMRKLGKGQSVIFCIPEEVKSSILELTDKHEKSDIDVSDVLQWAVSETWMDTRHSMPLWVTQFQKTMHIME